MNNIQFNDEYYNRGERVYYIVFNHLFNRESLDTTSKMNALLMSGDIIDLLYNASNKLDGIHIEMSDSDIRQNLYFYNEPHFNVNILSAILSAEEYYIK